MFVDAKKIEIVVLFVFQQRIFVIKILFNFFSVLAWDLVVLPIIISCRAGNYFDI